MRVKTVMFGKGEFSREEIESISYSHQTITLSLKCGDDIEAVYERSSNAELSYRNLRNFMDEKGKK